MVRTSSEGTTLPVVQVGPFRVADLSRSDLVTHVVNAATAPRTDPVQVFALHVGGLNARQDRAFVEAMHEADVVYADGGSVVLLARLAGARDVQRAPTTDVGWDMLRGLGVALGRPPRLALVGGPPGLAERAGAVFQDGGAGEVAFSTHGYHQDWTATLAALRSVRPDACVIGLGAPREMSWVRDHLHELSGSVVLTCGGWFGHVTGEERRAPRLLRRSGVEWLARLAQAPGRLGPRYARGAVSTLVMATGQLRRRAAGRTR